MKIAFFLLTLTGSTTAFAPMPFVGSGRDASMTSSSLNMANIAVFGASGLTSSECVYQALQNGDTVVGLTRNPENLVIPSGSGGDKKSQPLKDEKLTCIAGDVTKMEDVQKVFEAADIDGVIVGLGGKTSDVGETMLTDGTTNIIATMKKKGVKRVAVVSSIGVGDSENQAPFAFKLLMMTVMKKISMTIHLHLGVVVSICSTLLMSRMVVQLDLMLLIVVCTIPMRWAPPVLTRVLLVFAFLPL